MTLRVQVQGFAVLSVFGSSQRLYTNKNIRYPFQHHRLFDVVQHHTKDHFVQALTSSWSSLKLSSTADPSIFISIIPVAPQAEPMAPTKRWHSGRWWPSPRPKRVLQQRPAMEVPMPGITAWQRTRLKCCMLIFTSIIKHLNLHVHDSCENSILLYKCVALWNIVDSVCVCVRCTYVYIHKIGPYTYTLVYKYLHIYIYIYMSSYGIRVSRLAGQIRNSQEAVHPHHSCLGHISSPHRMGLEGSTYLMDSSNGEAALDKGKGKNY